MTISIENSRQHKPYKLQIEYEIAESESGYIKMNWLVHAKMTACQNSRRKVRRRWSPRVRDRPFARNTRRELHNNQLKCLCCLEHDQLL